MNTVDFNTVLGNVIYKHNFMVYITFSGTGVEVEYIALELANGQTIKVPMEITTENVKSCQPDKVKDYAHNALESGLTFMLFLELVKTPERESLLSLFKMMMLLLRGRNINAKYPLEILRLLIQQYSLLPLQEACQTFHMCFVNTKGKVDSHVPADLQNEWIVKEQKKHLKHMYSNKTTDNIYTQSAALPGITEIADHFDNELDTVQRTSRHSRLSTEDEELHMIKDMRQVRPFQHIEGRHYSHFRTIPRSKLDSVDGYLLNAWINKHKNRVELWDLWFTIEWALIGFCFNNTWLLAGIFMYGTE